MLVLESQNGLEGESRKGNTSGKESIGMKDFWSREEQDAGRV